MALNKFRISGETLATRKLPPLVFKELCVAMSSPMPLESTTSDRAEVEDNAEQTPSANAFWSCGRSSCARGDGQCPLQGNGCIMVLDLNCRHAILLPVSGAAGVRGCPVG